MPPKRTTSSFSQKARPNACLQIPNAASAASKSLAGTAAASASVAERWSSPATGLAEIRSSSAATFLKWRARSISAIPGNRGDAVIWGDALGAQLSHLGAYQGHGSVATPHNILITWATIMQGGIQVNGEGRRFCDETHGYSEQAAEVLRQPGGIAWTVFDARIAAVARQFDDFRKAESAGAILTADSIARSRERDTGARCDVCSRVE